MKSKFLYSISSVLLMFFSGATIAAGWSGGSTIQEIYPSPVNNGILIKHNSMPNPDSCPSPTYYMLSKENVLFSEIYTLIVSAQARKSNINLHLSGCGGRNSVYPLINQLIAN